MKRLGKPFFVFNGKYKRICPSCGQIADTKE